MLILFGILYQFAVHPVPQSILGKYGSDMRLMLLRVKNTSFIERFNGKKSNCC